MSHRTRLAGIYIALPILIVSAALTGRAAVPSGSLLTTSENEQLRREARLVVNLLQHHHLSGRAFRDIDAEEIVARYLEELDPAAVFFSSEDVTFVRRRFARTLKSVYLFRGDLQPAFEIFDLFAERFRARMAWIEWRLTQGIDLTLPELLAFEDKPRPCPAGPALERRWEERLKDQLLHELTAGRPYDAARTAVRRHYDEAGRRIATMDSFAIREFFFDAVIRSFDPHSGYFSAESAEEFAVSMENTVVGVGLELRKDSGRCVVTAVHPGGPADLHSTLAPRDVILGLTTADGTWFDATNTRLSELVGLMHGSAGEQLQIAYAPGGSGPRTEVTLARARVMLTEDRAHGAISEVRDAAGRVRRIGWIELPAFYTGHDGDTKHGAAGDLRELIDQMAVGPGIDGLVLDLRTNPGGALTEAMAVSGLFLPGGTIALTRGIDGKITEHSLPDNPPHYAGPLVILTSPASASASEITAGAMKFHHRAVIVGGPATFGKGTSQAYIPLGKMPGSSAPATKDWGTLRLTIDQFFLPDGRAVQQAGVASQIVLPGTSASDQKREADLPHALPAEFITRPASPARPAGTQAATSEPLLQHLRALAAGHVAELPEWDLWQREQGRVFKPDE